MKKIIFSLAFISLALSAWTQTNVYHPFPESNAIWSVYYSDQCWPFYRYYTEEYQYTLGKDTIIDKYTYKKIYESGFYHDRNCSGDYTPHYFYSYAGGLRQDTINKKVYFRYNSDHDSILYDFNKKVGDTIFQASIAIPSKVYKIVISYIDSVLVGSSYRKQFHLDSCSYTMIEGIGNTSGLLEPLRYDEIGGVSWNLICFQHNSDIYPDTLTACKTTKVNEIINKNSQINIYPNPTDGLINIKTDLKNYKIEITDLTGRIIYKSANSEKKINLSNKPDGICFIRIIQNNTILKTSKLIINKLR